MPQAAIMVLTTMPQRVAAEALARELIAARLAACVHVGPTVLALYHWRGKIETGEEVPLAIKTRAALFRQVEQAIRARHPYELPEVIAVPITDGLPAYLDWITAQTSPPDA